jgi:hypothetical protein
MSKLGTILQKRALPPVPQNILFSDCNPAVPPMFHVVAKSWQNSGAFPIVDESTLHEVSASIDESASAQKQPAQQTAELATNLAESENHWMTRLAAEWQIGIETLLPHHSANSAISEAPTPSISAMLNTEYRKSDHANDELGLTTEVTRTYRFTEPKPYAPTSYLAEKLIEAIQNGTSSTVEQVLKLINGQSQSAIAVLSEVKERFARTTSTPLTVDWEIGTDAHGKTYTRLNFTVMRDWSLRSGYTKLLIGSDGTTYATYTESWDNTPLFLSPDDAIAQLKFTNLKRIHEQEKALKKDQNSVANFKSTKAPRHFKAAG